MITCAKTMMGPFFPGVLYLVKKEAHTYRVFSSASPT